jgi:acyl-CoA hydrolase
MEFGAVQLKRKMVPVDANPAGNVHGGMLITAHENNYGSLSIRIHRTGTILELAEQAGYVAANKHMFQYNKGCVNSPGGSVSFTSPTCMVSGALFGERRNEDPLNPPSIA